MKNKMHAGASSPIYQRARELRNQSTHAEDLLWGYFKTKPNGLKFRRQHPYSIYILDFYCHALKLVIEVDGTIHDKEAVGILDRQRQEILENDGLTIIRFTNQQVLMELEKVMIVIEQHINQKNDSKQ